MYKPLTGVFMQSLEGTHDSVQFLLPQQAELHTFLPMNSHGRKHLKWANEASRKPNMTFPSFCLMVSIYLYLIEGTVVIASHLHSSAEPCLKRNLHHIWHIDSCRQNRSHPACKCVRLNFMVYLVLSLAWGLVCPRSRGKLFQT